MKADTPSTLEQARAAKARAEEVFRGLPVVGIGITRIDNGYGLKVNLSREADQKVPAEVDGVPVRHEVVGVIQKR
jgi:hypothetical protein